MHVPVVEAFFWDGESSGRKPNCTGLIDNVCFSGMFDVCPKDIDRLQNDICVKRKPREIIVTAKTVENCSGILRSTDKNNIDSSQPIKTNMLMPLIFLYFCNSIFT